MNECLCKVVKSHLAILARRRIHQNGIILVNTIQILKRLIGSKCASALCVRTTTLHGTSAKKQTCITLLICLNRQAAHIRRNVTRDATHTSARLKGTLAFFHLCPLNHLVTKRLGGSVFCKTCHGGLCHTLIIIVLDGIIITSSLVHGTSIKLLAANTLRSKRNSATTLQNTSGNTLLQTTRHLAKSKVLGGSCTTIEVLSEQSHLVINTKQRILKDSIALVANTIDTAFCLNKADRTLR